jgi:hypothetical protein
MAIGLWVDDFLSINSSTQLRATTFIYLSVVTRADIAYVVSMISQNMQHPTNQDWSI